MIDIVTKTVVLVSTAGHILKKGVKNTDFFFNKFIEVSLKFCRLDFLSA